MSTADGILIVGASLAGLSAAEALRERGATERITMIGAEPHLPYSRPALSKQVLSGQWTAEQAAITDVERLDANGITFVGGVRARGVDLAERRVLTDGGEYGFDRLVIATGVVPRRPDAIPSARTIRTVDDIVALRAAFATGPRVAIVGAGVLGCELASAAREAGLAVTLIGRTSTVGLGPAGSLIGTRAEELLAAHGVELRLDVRVVDSRDSDGATTLFLSDGSEIVADLVVVAIGCEPAVDWLRGSGLDLTDGVLCDTEGRAAPGVFAIGDVARWPDPHTGIPERVEHQAHAIEQGHAVADVLTSQAREHPQHSFFWTELFGTRIQVLGRFPEGSTAVAVAGDPNGDRFVIAAEADGVTRGLVGWNMAREFRVQRSRLDLVDSTKGSTLP